MFDLTRAVGRICPAVLAALRSSLPSALRDRATMLDVARAAIPDRCNGREPDHTPVRHFIESPQDRVSTRRARRGAMGLPAPFGSLPRVFVPVGKSLPGECCSFFQTAWFQNCAEILRRRHKVLFYMMEYHIDRIGMVCAFTALSGRDGGVPQFFACRRHPIVETLPRVVIGVESCLQSQRIRQRTRR